MVFKDMNDQIEHLKQTKETGKIIVKIKKENSTKRLHTASVF